MKWSSSCAPAFWSNNTFCHANRMVEAIELFWVFLRNRCFAWIIISIESNTLTNTCKKLLVKFEIYGVIQTVYKVKGFNKLNMIIKPFSTQHTRNGNFHCCCCCCYRMYCCLFKHINPCFIYKSNYRNGLFLPKYYRFAFVLLVVTVSIGLNYFKAATSQVWIVHSNRESRHPNGGARVPSSQTRYRNYK